MVNARHAVVIGSGPNGLSGAILLAEAGWSVTVLEAQPHWGGGMRSEALTLPGFVHDVCSAVYPLGIGSRFFQSLPLEDHGLEWVHSPAPLAHALDDGSAVMLERSIGQTAAGLGEDGRRYRQIMEPLVRRWDALRDEIMEPLHWPAHPLLLGLFGTLALPPASALARTLFRTERARALFAGNAAHSVLPLEQFASSAIGWVLMAAGHAVGWPIPRGGSGRLAAALVSHLRSLGGEVVTGQTVRSLNEIKDAQIVLADVSPRGLVALAGDAMPAADARKLEEFEYGAGAFKLDWALNGPIPWKASDCARAATVHLGGTLDEIAASEASPEAGSVSRRPFTLLVQPSLFDGSRAPEGRHTAWAYCHVPPGYEGDATSLIEDQVERFAPGFRERILARHVLRPADLERGNANLVGGHFAGGKPSLGQLFLRPTRRLYRTPVKGLYLCSASTPPGAGVHGMCGYWAAKAALDDVEA